VSAAEEGRRAARRALPDCGKNLVQRFGRFGEFVACSGYPKCKYTKQPTIGVKCPKCSEGELVERNSRRGKFYGCNRYPDCDFTSWASRFRSSAHSAAIHT
jgi:DNA topoisomerase-1